MPVFPLYSQVNSINYPWSKNKVKKNEMQWYIINQSIKNPNLFKRKQIQIRWFSDSKREKYDWSYKNKDKFYIIYPTKGLREAEKGRRPWRKGTVLSQRIKQIESFFNAPTKAAIERLNSSRWSNSKQESFASWKTNRFLFAALTGWPCSVCYLNLSLYIQLSFELINDEYV